MKEKQRIHTETEEGGRKTIEGGNVKIECERELADEARASGFNIVVDCG